MTLQSRLAALISSIGADVKALQAGTFVGAGYTEEVLANNYVNETTTGSDIFVGFTPGASKRYLVEACLIITSASAANGSQFMVATPTGISSAGCRIHTPWGAAADAFDAVQPNVWSTGANGMVTPAIAVISALIVYGTSPGSGKVRIQGRSETNLANGLTAYPPSVMRWRELT